MENAPDIKSKSLKLISMIDPEIYIDFLNLVFNCTYRFSDFDRNHPDEIGIKK